MRESQARWVCPGPRLLGVLVRGMDWIQSLLVLHGLGQRGSLDLVGGGRVGGVATSIISGVRQTWVQILTISHTGLMLGNWASLSFSVPICKWEY